MRGNGLVVWLIAGVGVVLMYAAIKGASIASVLAGHPVSTSTTSSSSPGPSVHPDQPFSPSNPFGRIPLPKGTRPLPPAFTIPGLP